MITLSTLFTLELISVTRTDPSPNTRGLHPWSCLDGLKYHTAKLHKLTVAAQTELRPRGGRARTQTNTRGKDNDPVVTDFTEIYKSIDNKIF